MLEYRMVNKVFYLFIFLQEKLRSLYFFCFWLVHLPAPSPLPPVFAYISQLIHHWSFCVQGEFRGLLPCAWAAEGRLFQRRESHTRHQQLCVRDAQAAARTHPTAGQQQRLRFAEHGRGLWTGDGPLPADRSPGGRRWILARRRGCHHVSFTFEIAFLASYCQCCGSGMIFFRIRIIILLFSWCFGFYMIFFLIFLT